MSCFMLENVINIKIASLVAFNVFFPVNSHKQTTFFLPFLIFIPFSAHHRKKANLMNATEKKKQWKIPHKAFQHCTVFIACFSLWLLQQKWIKEVFIIAKERSG